MDLNRDGTFGAGERLFYTIATTEVDTTLNIPATADTGLTRLRVVMSRNAVSHPCKTFREGEIEDYAVVLLP